MKLILMIKRVEKKLKKFESTVAKNFVVSSLLVDFAALNQLLQTKCTGVLVWAHVCTSSF